ncbi:hypothetical protein FA95DRAFT_618469 [Auriscalpium vulgare]|uniref:Uncharacterized protein n=1 Tax=Auriscalpium vulgare TaxID=40419 RepID=A0ACB8S2X3_9AGAM|nr:hypothetical protein FA95DRAFT_618469 [Auriscalpium vulgare]
MQTPLPLAAARALQLTSARVQLSRPSQIRPLSVPRVASSRPAPARTLIVIYPFLAAARKTPSRRKQHPRAIPEPIRKRRRLACVPRRTNKRAAQASVRAGLRHPQSIAAKSASAPRDRAGTPPSGTRGRVRRRARRGSDQRAVPVRPPRHTPRGPDLLDAARRARGWRCACHTLAGGTVAEKTRSFVREGRRGVTLTVAELLVEKCGVNSRGSAF